MNKKTIIILLAAIVLIILAGFIIYQYRSNFPGVQNSAGGAQTGGEIENNLPIEVGGVEVNSGSNGGLSICADKCGDGTCQKTDSTCPENSLNCACEETPQNCSQDCK